LSLDLERVLNELDRAFAVHKQHDAEAERRIAAAAGDLREFLSAEGGADQLREALKKRPPAQRIFAQQLARRMEVSL
jgi:hypothetical protein